eukprot:CAMPEP_0194070744 /NCGR_PEP_ID=MMETSP0009_2-20130614/88342_1 /TAXON_ID=210454 /ORGANISM="Grammatophora oceanica, Strain CCMP 410" /LENGTH=118 /DNA_ID=CAMNT_0038724031 /DNA_START=24 /DNA_END=380 /DNA_ORIENTATION=+
MSNSELHYPGLVNCKVSMTNSSVKSRPPEDLPRSVRDAAKIRIPPLYAYAVEKSVLQKKEERDLDIAATSTGSRDEIERSIMVKMKSVTKADEDVCVAVLQSNGYNLKNSIEAFFQSK